MLSPSNEIGRNDPCYCGSGKKYKKCCITKESEVLKMAQAVLIKKAEQQKKLQDLGIFINFVNPVTYKHPATGKQHKVWGVGNKLYHTRRAEETFHEFIIDILRETLGKEWWEKEIATNDRHFIGKCFLAFQVWRQHNATNPASRVDENTFYGMPDGWSKSLLSLAFDVISLQHTQQLPESLLKMLRNKNEYQGARYEIAIAAIFARLDCKITFLNDQEKSKKHCEFIAKDVVTGSEIAVEAKSRHRAGVLHTLGVFDEAKAIRGDVNRFLKEALEQNPGDKPFMIFIDLNCLPTPKTELQQKQWFKDIKNMFGKYGISTPENPDQFNAIFFTNYSYHYQTDKEADRGETLSVIPNHTKQPMPHPLFINRLLSALDNYGAVPNIEEKNQF